MFFVLFILKKLLTQLNMFFLFLRAKTVFHNLVPKYIYFFLNTKPILKNYSQKLFSFWTIFKNINQSYPEGHDFPHCPKAFTHHWSDLTWIHEEKWAQACGHLNASELNDYAKAVYDNW